MTRARPNRWDKIITQWEGTLGRAFVDSVYNLRSAAHVEQIARMLDAGNIDGAVRATAIDSVSFRPYDKAIADAFEAGGKHTADLIPVQTTPEGFRVVVQFDVRNRAAEYWLKEHSSTQIKGILDDQRAMVRDFLTKGMAAGNNPRTTALDLVGRIGASGRREGGVIGLSSSQVEWVNNYAADLASDDPTAALTRSLRDARFDSAVINASESGEPLAPDLIESMVDSYTNRALRYRAESIARTESMAALHEAQSQAMDQAIESGAVTQDQVSYIWNTAGDDRVRPSHETMDGQEVAMGEMFTTGDGAQLEYPGDPNGPPEEIIACRCWREPSIDFLSNLD
jgi:hypothetical protein